MAMPNRTFNSPDYRYGFNGKEKDESGEFGNLTSYDFGARIYNPGIGRFLSSDFFSGKYPSSSPYSFAGNNPIIAIDVGGDSIWITPGQIERGKTGVLQVVNTLNVTISVLDVSRRGLSQTEINTIASSIQGELNQELNLRRSVDFANPEDPTKTERGIEKFVANVQVGVVNSMADVSDRDHLLVLVDDVTHDEGYLDGSYTEGVAKRPGKIAYVQTYPNVFWKYSVAEIIKISIHELGHSLGLKHTWEDGLPETGDRNSTNHMSYGEKRTELTNSQVLKIINSRADSNRGKNYEKVDSDKSGKWKSTSSKPYKGEVKKGDKIPKPIKD